MGFCCLFRHQQTENQIHGFAIHGIEVDAFAQLQKGSGRFVYALDAGMGQGDTVVHASAAQAFTVQQLFVDGLCRWRIGARCQ